MWLCFLQFYSPGIHGYKTDMSLEHLLSKWEKIRQGCSYSSLCQQWKHFLKVCLEA